jgi:small-conductance mechanosensitive channel
MDYENLLEISIWTFTVKELLLSLGVFFLSLAFLKVFKTIIIGRLKKLSKITKTDFDDVLIEIINKIKSYFYLFIALYFSLKYLSLPETFGRVIDGLFVVVVAFQLAKSAEVLIVYGAKKMTQGGKEKVGPKDERQTHVISLVLKILLWAFVLLSVLSNLGINVTSLIAGLGISGVAIAFALQNILGDIFSSFSIYFDKPFIEGDFIIVGGDMGTVKKIGIKSTRLQTLQGEELVISNKELTEARVHNYKRMSERRIVFSFGVAYETPLEKLKKIPQIVENIVSDVESARLDRAHFKEFGDFSLNYEVVYYVLVPDYNKYMDVQQEINIALKEKFKEEGIEFAYPTYTLNISRQS